MVSGPRLHLKQSQTLSMTPQMQQAIKLLQMSNLELAGFVEAELEKNPLLERAEPASDSAGPESRAETEFKERQALDDHARQLENAGRKEDRDDIGKGRDMDENFGEVWSDREKPEGTGEAVQAHGFDASPYTAGAGKGGSLKFDDPDYNFENTLADEKTLRAHLMEQIHLSITGAREQMIAGLLVDHLDEAGYLRCDLAALSLRLGCPLEKTQGVLDQLQGFDPAGIFARSLSECLALQLREKNRLDPAMQKLLDHLELLGKHDHKGLMQICGVDREDLSDMVAEIRALNPKPGMGFEHTVVQTALPDVLMKPLPKSAGGGWAVELNADTLPRVLANKIYYAEVSKNARTREEKNYVSEQWGNASWLIKALDQRAQTILKVASEIIRRQDAFFTYGVEYLKPLVLREIAEITGLHESTVSRVTSHKFIATPRGLFELKYFFSSGVGSTDGATEFAASAIKAKIKALIDHETAACVLSDDDLVLELKKAGVDIARRTVAKYRESLDIPSSVQRRRRKKLDAS